MMKTFDWKDENSWPKNMGKEHINDDDNCMRFVEQFSAKYSHVLVYHSCRPTNPNAYLQEGIRVGDRSTLIETLKYNAKKYYDIELYNYNIDSMLTNNTYKNGKIYVVLDDEFLLEWAGHYCIYGSEYIISVANEIDFCTGIFTKEHLKGIGTPTVYRVLLPIKEIEQSDLNALVREVNNAIYEDEIASMVDFTFELSTPIPPAYILNCYYPNTIKDPLNARKYYKSRQAPSVG